MSTHYPQTGRFGAVSTREHSLESLRIDARALIHPACSVIETTHDGRRVYAVQHPHKSPWTLDSGPGALLFAPTLAALAARIRENYL